MIKIRIRSTWNGLIPIRGKYVDKALEKHIPISVFDNKSQKTYELTPILLFSPYSRKQVPDKFSTAIHWLCYYKIPKEMDQEQLILIK